MQTNLHRFSEVAVTPKDTNDAEEIENNRRSFNKRPREHDIDTESELDDCVGGNHVTPNPEIAQATTQAAEDSSTTFLTFDWANEEPYERAVKRYLPTFPEKIILVFFLNFFFYGFSFFI